MRVITHTRETRMKRKVTHAGREEALLPKEERFHALAVRGASEEATFPEDAKSPFSCILLDAKAEAHETRGTREEKALGASEPRQKLLD